MEQHSIPISGNTTDLYISAGAEAAMAERYLPALSIPPGHGRQAAIVSSFRRMLCRHYQDLYNGHAERAFNAKEYADALGLHPNYLNYVIRQRTGKPVSKWIINKTISESKFLLAYSGLSIKEIAYRLGFTEPSYFSRYFRKYAQVTAAAYRSSIRNSGTNTPAHCA